MALGSPDKAARLGQLAAFARVQVRSGLRSRDQVEEEVYGAVLVDLKEPVDARARAHDLVETAYDELAAEAPSWPGVTDYDRLQSAITDLETAHVIVLQGCEDHWSANARLAQENARGRGPRGIAYFTHPDVWHAVEHDMLEVNLWHGSSANVAAGDDLLSLVQETLSANGLSSLFDEGRIEVTLRWQRRSSLALR